MHRILIVDDEPLARERLKELLEDCRAEVPHRVVGEAANGLEALEAVQKSAPDIVLVDMHMHVLTGLETVRIVKQFQASLPCILITADATDELVREATDAEAYSVLKKPVRKADLLQAVDSAMVATYQNSPFHGVRPNAA